MLVTLNFVEFRNVAMTAPINTINNCASLIDKALQIFGISKDVFGNFDTFIVPYFPATHALNNIGTEATLTFLDLINHLTQLFQAFF